MPRLAFAVAGATVAEAVAPAIALAVRVERTGGAPVRSAALAAQVRIAAARRPYDGATRARLRGLFGTAEQWPRAVRSLLWARPTLTLPAFERETTAELLLPYSYDAEVAHAGYLGGVRDGTIPLELLFSGTVFSAGADGRLQAAQLPWDCEATYALPAALWQAAMDRHFPGARWLRLDVATLDRLAAYRAERALPTWEATVAALLEEAGR